MNITSHDLLRLQVFSTTISCIDNNALLSEIRCTENSIPDKLISGFGTHTTHTWFEDGLYPWGKPESLKLISEIENISASVSGSEMVVDEAWTITLDFGQSVMSHSHRSNWHMFPCDYYSVAYYVNAPSGSAPLIFDVGYCDINQSTYSIQPETGMVVIFNSFIKHMTGRHMSKEKRVVVSSNLSPRNPRTDRIPDLSPYIIGR